MKRWIEILKYIIPTMWRNILRSRFLLIILLFTTPLFAETLKTESSIKKHLKEKGFYAGKQRERVYLEKINDDWVITDRKKVIKTK